MSKLKAELFVLLLASCVLIGKGYKHYGLAHKYIVNLIQLNWHAAYAFCEQNGWKLLSIEKPQQQFELENFLNYFNLQNQTFWTAGNSLEGFQSFRWDYDGDYFGYTNWAPSQPDNYMGREHCVRLIENHIQWDDYPCEKVLHFICQAETPKK